MPCFCAAKEDIEAITAAIEGFSVEELDVENERILVGDQRYTAVVKETARPFAKANGI